MSPNPDVLNSQVHQISRSQRSQISSKLHQWGDPSRSLWMKLWGPYKMATDKWIYHISIKNWMGPYQRTPKEVAIQLLDTPGLGVRSVGPVGDFLEYSIELYITLLIAGWFPGPTTYGIVTWVPNLGLDRQCCWWSRTREKTSLCWPISGWWFQHFFLMFYPENWGFMIHFDERVFQMGWGTNHQLDFCWAYGGFLRVGCVCVCCMLVEPRFSGGISPIQKGAMKGQVSAPTSTTQTIGRNIFNTFLVDYVWLIYGKTNTILDRMWIMLWIPKIIIFFLCEWLFFSNLAESFEGSPDDHSP